MLPGGGRLASSAARNNKPTMTVEPKNIIIAVNKRANNPYIANTPLLQCPY